MQSAASTGPITSIVYSSRKTLSISVMRSGEVIIRAPSGTTRSKIDDLATKNSEWINRKIEEQREKSERFVKLEAKNGESVCFLGREHKIITPCSGIARIQSGNIYLPTANPQLDELKQLLKQEAKLHLANRLEKISLETGLKYKKLKVTSAKRRWGSCSSDDSINLTWMLIMCPEHLIDYIIIHELCHTIHKNHSKLFWEMVESYLPNAQELKKELSRYEFVLEYFD
ncbi:MAG: M48 family metallopeptidase [Eubacteriaceae bacterium]|nr:M48 family metallopeptidase [Eubacteriaceae bacterium]